MSESTHNPNLQLPPDLTLAGREPAHRGKAGDIAYPAHPQTEGMELDWDNSPQPADLALDYTSRLLGKNRSELTVLSDQWSSSIVLEDVPQPGEQTKVYKVFRQASYYDYIENEMVALTFLHDLNLAPKPYLLIDAGQEYRSTDELGKRSTFGNVPIARQDLGSELPIIVMDKVEQEPLEVMSDEQLTSEFMRVVRAGIDYELMFGDTEIVYDRSKGRVTFLDLGGVSHQASSRRRYAQDGGKLIDAYPHKTDEELLTTRVAADVLRHFLYGRKVPMSDEKVGAFINENGLEALSDVMLYHMRNAPRQDLPQFPNIWQPPQPNQPLPDAESERPPDALAYLPHSSFDIDRPLAGRDEWLEQILDPDHTLPAVSFIEDEEVLKSGLGSSPTQEAGSAQRGYKVYDADNQPVGEFILNAKPDPGGMDMNAYLSWVSTTRRSEGFGKAMYLAVLKSLPEGLTLASDDKMTEGALGMWRWLESRGVATQQTGMKKGMSHFYLSTTGQQIFASHLPDQYS